MSEETPSHPTTVALSTPHPPPGDCTHVPAAATASRLHPRAQAELRTAHASASAWGDGLVKRTVAVFHPKNLARLNVLFS